MRSQAAEMLSLCKVRSPQLCHIPAVVVDITQGETLSANIQVHDGEKSLSFPHSPKTTPHLNHPQKFPRPRGRLRPQIPPLSLLQPPSSHQSSISTTWSFNARWSPSHHLILLSHFPFHPSLNMHRNGFSLRRSISGLCTPGCLSSPTNDFSRISPRLVLWHTL